jgi:hypothetical protein
MTTSQQAGDWNPKVSGRWAGATLIHHGDATEVTTQSATTRSRIEADRERRPRTGLRSGLPAAAAATTSTAAREPAASETA